MPRPWVFMIQKFLMLYSQITGYFNNLYIVQNNLLMCVKLAEVAQPILNTVGTKVNLIQI